MALSALGQWVLEDYLFYLFILVSPSQFIVSELLQSPELDTCAM